MQDNNSDDVWSTSSEEVLNKCFPLHRACRDGDIQQLGSLLSSGQYDLYQEDDFYGWTPIHWAAYFGKLSCLSLLQENSVCIDATTERLNQSPAHIVAYGGHATCLKWLLQHGSLINRQLACLRRTIDMVKSLGVVGCDMVSSRFSQTPSHLCAYAGHPQCLYWLIQSRCNLNMQDYMGETPIHKAARTGSMECISLLVSQGAKLDIRNYSGLSASQVARQANHVECANYLDRALELQQRPTDSDQTRGTPDGQPASSQSHFISTNTYHSNPYFINHENTPTLTNGLSHDNNIQSEDCDMEMEAAGIDGNNMADNMAASGDVLLDNGVTRNVIPVAGRKREREESENDCYKRARNDDYVFMDGDNNRAIDQNDSAMADETHMDSCENTAPSSHQNGFIKQPLMNKSKLNGWLQNNSHIAHELTNQELLNEHLSHKGSNEGSLFNHMTQLSNELTNQQSNHMTGISQSMVEHSTSIILQQGYDNSLVLDALITECHGS